MGTSPKTCPPIGTGYRTHRSVKLVWLAFLMLAMVSCNRACKSQGNLHQEKAAANRAIEPAREPVLICPPAGSPMLDRMAPGTGDHTVSLSWLASAPSSNPRNNAVGYCLYRTTIKDAAKKIPNCSNCEQINFTPVSGTNCVDDRVQNGKTYYYVVAAISPRRELSISSNQAVAVIPQNRKKLDPDSSSSYPLCRGPDSPTPAPTLESR